LELISSELGHRGPSPPPHDLIGDNPLISGQWIPLSTPICRVHEAKFAAARVRTPK
jgi:hypothetical protein